MLCRYALVMLGNEVTREHVRWQVREDINAVAESLATATFLSVLGRTDGASKGDQNQRHTTVRVTPTVPGASGTDSMRQLELG